MSNNDKASITQTFKFFKTMTNVLHMAAEIKAKLVRHFGEDLVNEVVNLGIESCNLSYDEVGEMDAMVFMTGVCDAKKGVFDTLEIGYNCEVFNDAYLAGWTAYLRATNSKKKQFTVKNI